MGWVGSGWVRFLSGWVGYIALGFDWRYGRGRTSFVVTADI